MQRNAESLSAASSQALQSSQAIDLTQWLTAANDDNVVSIKFLVDTVRHQLINGCREIHLEQERDLCRLRCRSRGQLDEAKLHTANLVPELIRTFSRLAMQQAGNALSRINQATHGEITFNLLAGGSTYRVEATFYPTSNGSCLTLSLFTSESIPETLDHTTLGKSATEWLREHFAKTPRGITLVCCPNADQLQDIFYASLFELNGIERKTVSIEHAVLKNVSRISQLAQAGQSNALSVIRIANKHSDNVFVDWQSTQNAQLLSQLLSDNKPLTLFLKTVDAPIGIRSLIDSVIDEKQLARNINTVIELSDVNIICPHCGDNHTLSGRDMTWLEQHSVLRGRKAKESFVFAHGCDRCNYTGSSHTRTLLAFSPVSDSLSVGIESRSCEKIARALYQGQATNSLSHQIETLVRSGKTSFPDFKRRR